jgi:hypothetical protein
MGSLKKNKKRTQVSFFIFLSPPGAACGAAGGLSLLLNPGTGNSRLVHTNLYGRSRLYIKQHFSHPPVNQSVAITYITDGLQTRNSLTVFTSIANIYTSGKGHQRWPGSHRSGRGPRLLFLIFINTNKYVIIYNIYYTLYIRVASSNS